MPLEHAEPGTAKDVFRILRVTSRKLRKDIIATWEKAMSERWR